MKKLILSIGGAGLLALAGVAGVLAASPTTGAAPAVRGSVIADILGLTQPQVQELRHDGKSLAQIAEGRSISPERLIDALESQWATRIDARVATGALSASQATELKAQLEVRARGMVNRTTTGGMRGAAVGGRQGAGMGGGMGAGGRMGGSSRGACDGTGPQGTGS